MTSKKKNFYGKEVADAIKEACETLNVPQEQLEIEVIETGSTGIFGLIRKKAHITAQVKSAATMAAEMKVEEQAYQAEVLASELVADEKPAKKKGAKEPQKQTQASAERVERQEKKEEDLPRKQKETGKKVKEQEVPSEKKEALQDPAEDDLDDTLLADDENGSSYDNGEEIPEEALGIIKAELVQLLDLMGYGSDVEVSAKGSSVFVHVGEKYQDVLTGQDGKTLDSIQYLLRKIVARKVPNRLRLSVDVGDYREKRLDELKQRAGELAEKVKASGKTQVIAALSPSERRVIHMSLQDDKEIRSRSVGDGLFKKILIYKPGKGGKAGGRKRNNSRGRRGSSSKKRNEQS